jgi:type III secretion system YscQ/HrcQ family protein
VQSLVDTRTTPYRFEGIPAWTKNHVRVWNWYCRSIDGQPEWSAWLGEILGRLFERPDGVELKLTQTHMVETETAEQMLAFGSKNEISLGRGTENDVVMPAKAISSRHAKITLGETKAVLEDLGGKLGTYVWDKRLAPNAPQLLADGDQFSIFPYRFRVSLERRWAPASAIALAGWRSESCEQRDFVTSMPAGWRQFVVNGHPEAERLLLDFSADFQRAMVDRLLQPLGIEKPRQTVPSDDALVGFVMLAMLERVNRTLKFPTQFSFSRSGAGQVTDSTCGIALSAALRFGGLSGQFRIFVPLTFLERQLRERTSEPQTSFPNGLSWNFPISAGFVDLSPDEIAQVGLGDILVTEPGQHLLFPNDFGRGWEISEDEGNLGQYRFDKYFERGTSLETTGEVSEGSVKPEIGALPVRLHVVVGQKEFTLAEIQSLGPGTIVELEVLKSDPVRLMVNGKVLGEGELVDVEGKLAVKVLGWRST